MCFVDWTWIFSFRGGNYFFLFTDRHSRGNVFILFAISVGSSDRHEAPIFTRPNHYNSVMAVTHDYYHSINLFTLSLSAKYQIWNIYLWLTLFSQNFDAKKLQSGAYLHPHNAFLFRESFCHRIKICTATKRKCSLPAQTHFSSWGIFIFFYHRIFSRGQKYSVSRDRNILFHRPEIFCFTGRKYFLPLSLFSQYIGAFTPACLRWAPMFFTQPSFRNFSGEGGEKATL